MSYNYIFFSMNVSLFHQNVFTKDNAYFKYCMLQLIKATNFNTSNVPTDFISLDQY